ncbi:MAG: regulatory iron-sulfur-containing complex subunit RicT [Segetibacter sp.]
MGCGSCGTGTPNGCKSNGGCSTGSCNRMNVHDWLMNLPFSDPESTCKIVEVSFNNGSRKDFYRNPTLQHFEKGEYVTVEGVSGFDVGEVSLSGELVRIQLKKKGVDEFSAEIKKILRRSSDSDITRMQENKLREKEALVRSRAMARTLNLQMKLAEVEIQADGKKATFFYTADDRVDFRELIRLFAGEFKVKVEMRQIGARQEAGKVGGIGSCGRELCCSTWLTDFKSVNTTAARYQNLSINQTKLSGQCGRLKCCLNYELDTYLDALQHFPDNADVIQITRGPAYLVKKDIFKNLMWYTLPESNKHYPLTIVRVKEIQKMNAQGLKPDELEPVEIVSSKPKEVEPEFVDVVGQISLRSLERNSRRRKDREPVREAKQTDRKETQQQPYQQQPGNRTQQNRQKPPGQQKDNQRPQQQVPGNTVRPVQGVQQQRPANQGAEQQGRPPLQPSVKQNPTNQRPPNQGHPQQKPPLQKPPPENKKLPPEDKK